jgi:hypothetical protein
MWPQHLCHHGKTGTERRPTRRREFISGGIALRASALGPVDNTHTPFAGLLKDFAVGNGLADHGKPTRACMNPSARGVAVRQQLTKRDSQSQTAAEKCGAVARCQWSVNVERGTEEFRRFARDFRDSRSPRMKASFVARDRRLSWDSRRSASSIKSNLSEYNSFNGKSIRVVLHPWPAKWS